MSEPEEKMAGKSVLEIHEEFLRRVEEGSAKIRSLSIITVAVAALLAVSYVVQMALPYLGGGTTATVSLTDPTLVAFEGALTVLALAWLYVGISDYRFTSRLSRSIREAREKEKEIEGELAAESAPTGTTPG